MFFRGLFSLGRGEQQGQGNISNAPTARAPWDSDEHSWISTNQEDALAPNVGGRFGGRQGSTVQFDLPQHDTNTNPFGMGNNGSAWGLRPPA